MFSLQTLIFPYRISVRNIKSYCGKIVYVFEACTEGSVYMSSTFSGFGVKNARSSVVDCAFIIMADVIGFTGNSVCDPDGA